MNGNKMYWILVGLFFSLACFIATQVWSMNERLSKVEAHVESLLNRPWMNR